MLQGQRLVPGLGVLCQAGRIIAVLPAGAKPPARRIALPPEAILAPGLIDVQVNGGGGVLLNDDPSVGGIAAIAAAHRRLGTSFVLPTLITDSDTVMARAGAATVAAMGRVPGVLGLHLEGPWLGPAKPGVHPPAHIRAPDQAALHMALALAAGLAKAAPDGDAARLLITLAPETVPADAITQLTQAGIVISLGHSAAGGDLAQAAFAAGASGVTHLFNAMAPLTAREGGVAGAALTNPAVASGVIADGHHVAPDMLRLLRAAKAPAQIVLVSDAMSCIGTAMTEFDLLGTKVLRQSGRLVTEAGVLAGADICLLEAVRRAVGVLATDLAEALVMASAAPAALLGLSQSHGRIAPGARDEMILLDETGTLLGLFGSGAWQEGGV